MGGRTSAPVGVMENQESGEVAMFKKLRKVYEAKKETMDDDQLLAYLKSQYTSFRIVAQASGGDLVFPEGHNAANKDNLGQRQSTFLAGGGGSFARVSKLSIIQVRLQ